LLLFNPAPQEVIFLRIFLLFFFIEEVLTEKIELLQNRDELQEMFRGEMLHMINKRRDIIV
jgi:hypothetical protein